MLVSASIDHYIGDVAMLAHKIRDIENVDVLFVLVQMDSRVHLVARSRIAGADVGDIARVFRRRRASLCSFGNHQGRAADSGQGDTDRAAPPADHTCHNCTGHHELSRQIHY